MASTTSSGPTVARAHGHVLHRLGDFSASPRLLLLTAMAAIIGAIGACVAAALLWLIAGITNLAYYHTFSSVMAAPKDNTLGWWAVPVPIVGGLIVGLMARYGSPKIRGHGIPEALEAILIGRSKLSPKVAVLKPVSSAIAIGTGGPFGAEGPIIMTGAAFGSLFAQAFHLSDTERKTLLVAGAAAGMSAVFATPLAAVLLAVELLLFEWKPRSLVPVASAAAVASAVRVWIIGAGPLFPVPPHGALTAEGMVVALIVGLIAGGASAGLTKLVYFCEDMFAKVPIHWMWWPMLGGLAIGLGGLVEPRALGIGTEVIRSLFDGRLVGVALLGLMFAKALMWSISLGSGTSGGVLAPLLLMGGALGAVEASVIPFGDPGQWAMLSMAAMMGGTMRSPLTAVVFLLELTQDIHLLTGLLVACVAAHCVTVLVMRRSILTEKVARRGYHVAREYGIDPLERFQVEDVMRTSVPTVPATMRIDGMFRGLLHHDPLMATGQAWPIVSDDGSLAGVLTRSDVLRALDREGDEEPTALEAASPMLGVAYPDELVAEAMNAMIRHDVQQIAVVHRSDPTKLVGFLDYAAVATIWEELRDEDHVREAGRIVGRLRAFRRRMQRMGRAGSPDSNGS